MRIVYISSLPKTMSGGPKYSVPKQVNSQASFDEVFWINITPWGVDNTVVPCEIMLKVNEIINRILSISPDLVVFEDFYYINYIRISKSLKKSGIPYIIVPRGSLTRAAQKQKWYKKIPANLLMFIPFARNAIAIEYLTEKESDSSGKHWNKSAIIVPNGTSHPDILANPSKNKTNLRGIFIGRINLYHKGLDVFFEGCKQIKPLLEEKNCLLDFYGPYPENVGVEIQKIVKSGGLEQIVSIHKGIHGEEKETVLLNSDFFILTSRFEGLPMGLLEALAYGLPALVTDETNIGELIAEANAGFSSKCGVEGIQNNLTKMLTLSEDEIRLMSQNAVSFAKKFDWDEIARNAHNDYLALVGKEI